MPAVKNPKKFSNAFNRGLQYLYQGYASEADALTFLEKNLGRAVKTIRHWAYPKPKQHIEDELLYGFAWLVMKCVPAPLSWLEELFSATTTVIVLPITPDWLRACFAMAAHGINNTSIYQYPTAEEIEKMIQRVFVPQPSAAFAQASPTLWEEEAYAILRLLEAKPDRHIPLPVMERYWDELLRSDMPLSTIDKHYPTLQNILAKARQEQQYTLQVDITLQLLHYMHARWLMSERLTYVYSAIEAAHHLPNPGDALWLTGMLLIDGLGWILLEQENYASALSHIEMGLGVAEQIEPEADAGFCDLTVLGKVYLALFHLHHAHDAARAQAYLAQVHDLPCRAMIKYHYWRAHLLLAAAKKDVRLAEETYAAGLQLFQLSSQPIAKTGFFITAAAVFLELGNFWKTQTYLQADPLKYLDGDFSLPWYVEIKTILAQFAYAKGNLELAHQELYELFAVLEAKQKTHIKSRLLQNARRLYETINA